jgi:hypothetical protein
MNIRNKFNDLKNNCLWCKKWANNYHVDYLFVHNTNYTNLHNATNNATCDATYSALTLEMNKL